MNLSVSRAAGWGVKPAKDCIAHGTLLVIIGVVVRVPRLKRRACSRAS